MVQQIITLCDVCYDDDKHEAATAYRIGLGKDAWSLELCSDHYTELVAPLASVAERLGQAVKAKATKTRPDGEGGQGSNRPTAESCLVCGHHAPTLSALTMHMRTKHEGNLEAIYGTTCPLCARDFTTASALGGHLSRTHPEVAATHGGASLPEGFRYAADQGDPHGIVGKVLANLGLEALPPRVKR